MPALVTGRRDWPAILSLGFNIDRNGKRRKPTWASIVTLGILLPGFAIWGLFRVFATPTSVGLWGLAFGLYLFTMFGVTLGNHRYWTHRGFEASGMSMQGDIQGWVLNHRAHHRFADVVGKDPHSPYEYPGWRGFKGLLWAQGVWLFFAYERPPGYAAHRDLAQDRLSWPAVRATTAGTTPTPPAPGTAAGSRWTATEPGRRRRVNFYTRSAVRGLREEDWQVRGS